MILNLSSVSGTVTINKSYTLTNVAPAKPYLNVQTGTSTFYLPLTTNTSNEILLNKMIVQSGTTSYRGMDYVRTTQRSNYNTTSVGPGNMSSTTALTTKSTTNTSYYTTKTTTKTTPITVKTTTKTTPLTKTVTTKSAPVTKQVTTKTGTVTDYTSVTKTSFSIQLLRSSWKTNVTSADISTCTASISFIENADQTFSNFRPFAYEASKIRNNDVQLSMTTSYTSITSRCVQGTVKMVNGTTEQILSTAAANVNTLPNKTITATSSKNARPWHTSADPYSKYVVIGTATNLRQGLIHAHMSSSAHDGTNKVYWYTDIGYTEDFIGQTRNTYGTAVSTTNTVYSTGYSTTGTSSYTASSTTNTSYHTASTTTSTSPIVVTTTTGYSGVSSRTSQTSTWK